MNTTFTKSFLLAATVGATLALTTPTNAYVLLNGSGENGAEDNGSEDNGIYVNRGGQAGTTAWPLDISSLQVQSIRVPAPSTAAAERK